MSVSIDDKPVGLETWVAVQVVDNSGSIVHEHIQPGRSWTRQFLDLLQIAMQSAGVVGSASICQNVSGVFTSGIAQGFGAFDIFDSGLLTAGTPDWAIGRDYEGIQIGLGTNAVTGSDYALQTKALHGTASGNVIIGVQSTQPGIITSGTSGTAYFNIIRTFYNQSSASITFNEVGIYCRYADINSALRGTRFCIARDLITPTAVADGSIINITYSLRVNL